MKLFGYAFVGLFGLAAAGALMYMTFARHEVVVESSQAEFGLAALGEDVVEYLVSTPENTGRWQGDLAAGAYKLRVRVKATSDTRAEITTTTSAGADGEVFVFTAGDEEIGRVYVSYECDVDTPQDEHGIRGGSLESTRINGNSHVIGLDMWMGDHRGGDADIRVSARAEGAVHVDDIVAAIAPTTPMRVSSAL
jgi:hypothetical protein